MAKFTSFDPTDTKHTYFGVWRFSSNQDPRALYLSPEQTAKISLALTGGTSAETFSHFSIIVSGEGAFLDYRVNDEGGHCEDRLVWEGEEIALVIERIIEKLDDDAVADWIHVSIMTSNL